MILLCSALDCVLLHLHHWEVAHLVVVTVVQQLLPVGAVALLLFVYLAEPLLLAGFGVAHESLQKMISRFLASSVFLVDWR